MPRKPLAVIQWRGTNSKTVIALSQVPPSNQRIGEIFMFQNKPVEIINIGENENIYQCLHPHKDDQHLHGRNPHSSDEVPVLPSTPEPAHSVNSMFYRGSPGDMAKKNLKQIETLKSQSNVVNNQSLRNTADANDQRGKKTRPTNAATVHQKQTKKQKFDAATDMGSQPPMFEFKQRSSQLNTKNQEQERRYDASSSTITAPDSQSSGNNNLYDQNLNVMQPSAELLNQNYVEQPRKMANESVNSSTPPAPSHSPYNSHYSPYNSDLMSEHVHPYQHSFPPELEPSYGRQQPTPFCPQNELTDFNDPSIMTALDKVNTATVINLDERTIPEKQLIVDEEGDNNESFNDTIDIPDVVPNEDSLKQELLAKIPLGDVTARDVKMFYLFADVIKAHYNQSVAHRIAKDPPELLKFKLKDSERGI